MHATSRQRLPHLRTAIPPQKLCVAAAGLSSGGEHAAGIGIAVSQRRAVWADVPGRRSEIGDRDRRWAVLR